MVHKLKNLTAPLQSEANSTPDFLANRELSGQGSADRQMSSPF
jgi:hypothetical protein